MKENYPNIKQCFGLFGLSILCQLGAGFATFGLSNGPMLFASQLISNLLILSIALNFKYEQVDFRALFQDRSKFKPVIIPILILFNIAFVTVIDPIIALIPIPDSIKEIFVKMLSKDIWAYLGIAVVAPIGEELLFRRLMLPGLVKNYGVRNGILWSAFFFALFHLNPWQGISAFLIGIFLAWLYLKSNNIWLCIFLHFFNNSMSFAFFYFSDDPFMTLEDMIGFNYQLFGIIGISLVCMYFCFRLLQQQFAKNS